MSRLIKIRQAWKNNETGEVIYAYYSLNEWKRGIKNIFNHTLIGVDQFTGKNDTNCKEIYESDIVHLWIFPENESGDMRQIREIGHIEYKSSSFWIPESLRLLGSIEPHRKLEVIGTIYENYKLLEREERKRC